MAATLLLPATPAFAAPCADVWVDDNALPGGTGCTVASPVRTLQEGVASLTAAGGWVNVMPGTYLDDVTLTEDVRLRGVGPDGQPLASGASWAGAIHGRVDVAGDLAQVSRLRFVAPVGAGSWEAVLVRKGTGVVVDGNVFDGAGGPNKSRALQTSSTADGPISLVIKDNKITAVQFGMYLHPPSGGVIERNEVTSTTDIGIALNSDRPFALLDNTFSGNAGAAVVVDQNPITDKTFVSEREPTRLTLRRNKFSANPGMALYVVETVTTQVDAHRNWWGSDAGPRKDSYSPGTTPPNPNDPATQPVTDAQRQAARERISAQVDYDPWCRELGCTTSWVTVTGAVRDLAGAGIGGVSVQLGHPTSNTVWDTPTTSAVAATRGTYRSSFSVGGSDTHVRARVAGVYCATVEHAFKVTPSGSVSASFPHTTGGIALQVTNKATGDPVDAAVSISGPTSATGPTGADGRCDMPLDNGSYTVTVTAADYLSSGPVAVTVAGATTVKVPLVYDEAPSKVSGVVQRGATGEGMPGATVTAEAPGMAKRTATAGASGAFEMNVPEGSWTLTATAPGYHPSAVGPVLVTRTEDRPGVKLMLYTDHAGGGSTGTLTPRPTATPRPTPQPSSPDEPVDAEQASTRVSGSDRAGTAVALSMSMFEPGTPVVYVATSGGFADALSGGPAAVRQGGPILLVERDRVPDSTLAELRRLAPQRVVVLGGSGVISDGVAAQLDAELPVVDRLSGSDRFATAAAVSRATFPVGSSVAYIATGGGFADALSGGAAAALGRGPVLLVDGGAIPAPTAEELRRLGPRRIVVLGGEGAVPAAVLAELDAYTEGTVQRLSGPDRYATSAAIADATFQPGVDTVYVATGENFPDALAGVPAAGRERAPLLLVQRDAVPEPVVAQLRRLSPRRIVILGGSGAVSAQTEHTLASFATG